MKDMKKSLYIIGLLALAVTGCHHHDDPYKDLSKRTVIVYMAGENSLSYNATTDLMEMAVGSMQLSSNERLVAFVDQQSVNPPYIVEIKDSICDTVKVFREDFYASDPERFREVIEWIENRFPAANDNYALVLWGHATGWIVERDTIAQSRMMSSRRAYGLDYGNDNPQGERAGVKWMNITQMARALEGLPRFRYILADCCCMMCVEVAYELRNVTDFLIGSPAEIPSDGAPYHLLVKPMFGETADFYREIVDTYFDYYQAEYQPVWSWAPSYLRNGDYSVPLSVVDTRSNNMEELAQATRNVLKSPDDFVTANQPYYFAMERPTMYDMRSLMLNNLTSANYNSWMTAFSRAVPYSRSSSRWMTMYSLQRQGFFTFQLTEDNYGGLSMFVPNPVYDNTGSVSYNMGIKNMGWYEAVGWDRF